MGMRAVGECTGGGGCWNPLISWRLVMSRQIAVARRRVAQ
jgi:hypothetical protein